MTNNRKLTKYIYYVFIVFISLSACSTSRVETEKKDIAYAHILNIKKNGIILRLPTYSKSIETYKEFFEKSGDSTNYEKYDFLVKKATFLKKFAMKALNEKYNFSPVYVLPDTSITTFLSGKNKGVFLDSLGNIDESKEYAGEKPYFLLIKETDNSLLVTDDHLLKLPSPFPADNISSLDNIILFERFNMGNLDFYDEFFTKDLAILNNKFWKFYKTSSIPLNNE